MQSTSMFALSVAVVLWTTTLSVRAQDDKKSHPWASFPAGAWVEVHADHIMVAGKGAEPKAWASDSRMTVGAIAGSTVTIKYDNPTREVSAQASLVIPAVDALPGVRALGQWPDDVFPFLPQREPGMTPKGKPPIPAGVKTKVVGEEKVDVDGKPQAARVIKRAWKAGGGDKAQGFVLTAWVVEGIELPVKWTLTVDGKAHSESELQSLEETVKVGDVSIPCMVTLTKKHLTDGVIVERRWSSSQVPGFMVKMESKTKTGAYSLIVNESVTAFQATAEAEDEGNPPGSRPALGFMPAYESDEDGVMVDMVTPGGPSDEAGLKAGDLIIEIGGEPVFGLEDYMEVMPMLRIGKKVVVKIKRDGKNKDLTIVVGERGR